LGNKIVEVLLMSSATIRVTPSILTCLSELREAFRENYCENEQLKKEIEKTLYRETGNNNLWALCQLAMDF